MRTVRVQGDTDVDMSAQGEATCGRSSDSEGSDGGLQEKSFDLLEVLNRELVEAALVTSNNSFTKKIYDKLQVILLIVSWSGNLAIQS